MNILSKAAKRAKNFFSDTKKILKKSKRDIVKSFKRNYTNQKKESNFQAGKMLMFRYNAIHDQKKFDKNPLIVCLGRSRRNKKHMLGLNIHWMPVKQRVLLASLITEMLDNKKELSYEDIKPLLTKFKGSPILREYAIRRVSKKVMEIPKDVFLQAASISTPDWNTK